MSLPNFTDQDSTTYKTNIDETAADHETRINERVPNDGAYLDPTDGSIVLGSYKQGAIGYTLIDAGAPNYPKNNGVVYTFNGEHLSRCYSIFDASKESGNSTPFLYIQTYDNDGTPSGWHEFSFQDTIGGRSNVPIVGVDADDAEYEYIYTAINAPNGTNNNIITINNGGGVASQIACRLPTSSQGGLHTRTKNSTWSEWRAVSYQDTIGGGSNVIDNTGIGSANDLRVLHGFANVDTPTSDTYLIKTYKDNELQRYYQQAFGYNGTTGVWERHTIDNGTTWEPWVAISNVSPGINNDFEKVYFTLSGEEGEIILANLDNDLVSLGGLTNLNNGFNHDDVFTTLPEKYRPEGDRYFSLLARLNDGTNEGIPLQLVIQPSGVVKVWSPGTSTNCYIAFDSIVYKKTRNILP